MDEDANRELFLCMTELEDIIGKGLRYPENMTIRVDDYRLRELHHRMRKACLPWVEGKRAELAAIRADD